MIVDFISFLANFIIDLINQLIIWMSNFIKYPLVNTGIGLISGAFITHKLAEKRERIKQEAEAKKLKLNRDEQIAFICCELVFILEKFISDCSKVVCDNESIDDDSICMSSETPKLDLLRVKGSWSVIPSDMMYRIQSISQYVDFATEYLSHCYENCDFPGFHGEYINERRRVYAIIGIYSLKYVKKLRSLSKLPKSKFDLENPNGWKTMTMFSDAIKEIRDERVSKRVRFNQITD